MKFIEKLSVWLLIGQLSGFFSLLAQPVIIQPGGSFGARQAIGSGVENLRVVEQSADGTEVELTMDYRYDGFSGPVAQLLPVIGKKGQGGISAWFGADPVTVGRGRGTVTIKVRYFNDEVGVPAEFTSDQIRILILNQQGTAIVAAVPFLKTIHWGSADAPPAAKPAPKFALIEPGSVANAVEEKRMAAANAKAEADRREQARQKAEAEAQARKNAEEKMRVDALAREEARRQAEAEARRIARENQALQEKRLAEEKQRALEQQRAEEEVARIAREKRLADDQALAEANARDKARLKAEAEESARKEEEAKAFAEANRREQERLRADAEVKRIEQERKAAEAKRLAEEKLREELRAVAEAENLAREKRAAEDRAIAAAKARKEAEDRAYQEALSQAKAELAEKALREAHTQEALPPIASPAANAVQSAQALAIDPSLKTKITNVDVVNRSLDRSQMTFGVEFEYKDKISDPMLGIDVVRQADASVSRYFQTHPVQIGKSRRNFVLFPVKFQPPAEVADREAFATDKVLVYLGEKSTSRRYNVFPATMLLMWRAPGTHPVAARSTGNSVEIDDFKQTDASSGYVSVKYALLDGQGQLRARIYDSKRPQTADSFLINVPIVNAGRGLQLIDVRIDDEARNQPEVIHADTLEIVLADRNGKELARVSKTAAMVWARPK